MLRKMVGAYFTCVMLLVIMLMGIVLFDYLSFVHNGEFVLLQELNLSQYKVANIPNEDLQAAAKHLEDLYSSGYSRHDFLHIFTKVTLIVSPISFAVALFIRVLCKHYLSKKIRIAVLVFSIGTLLIVLLLRNLVQGTYAIAEVKRLYPIVCFLPF